MIDARDLTAGYDPASPSLRNASLQLGGGESLSVRGPSGSGKSTLLMVLAGILTPLSGSVEIDGKSLFGLSVRERSRVRREQIGFVFQFGEMLPELNVANNVAMPLLLAGVKKASALRSAAELLERFGLGGYEGRDVRSLSGGELQRAAIARSLVHRPALVLADEPTGALDEVNSRLILDELLEGCAERGVVLVIATHDPLVAQGTKRCVMLRDGAFVEQSDLVP